MQGKFLWKEKIIKTVSVLDVFVEFLSWGKPDFKYIPQNKLVTLKEFSDMPSHTEYYRRCYDGKYVYDVEYNIKDQDD